MYLCSLTSTFELCVLVIKYIWKILVLEISSAFEKYCAFTQAFVKVGLLRPTSAAWWTNSELSHPNRIQVDTKFATHLPFFTKQKVSSSINGNISQSQQNNCVHQIYQFCTTRLINLPPASPPGWINGCPTNRESSLSFLHLRKICYY